MPYQNALSDTPADSHVPITPGYLDSTTPFNPTTPGYPATPGHPQTPAAGTPWQYNHLSSVPAGPKTPLNPSTPMPTNTSDYFGGETWVTTDIQVRVVSNRKFKEGYMDEKSAVVKSIDTGRRQATIKLDSGETLVISFDFLQAVAPEKRQEFKVISGPDKGQTGSLLSIDGQEGVVRLDGSSEIVMMNLSALARLVKD